MASTEKYGFKKSKEDGATRYDVDFLTGPCPAAGFGSRRQEWEDGQPTEAQYARAAECLAWAQALEGKSDYEHNLKIAATLPVATKHEGLLASLPSAWDRTLARENEKRSEATNRVGAFIGEVGKREEWLVTFVSSIIVESDFGSKVIARFLGPQGEPMVWFCSGAWERLEGGQRVMLKGTVKKHDTYKGAKQTVLNRCIISPVEVEVAEAQKTKAA
jgi:hypothetical protein